MSKKKLNMRQKFFAPDTFSPSKEGIYYNANYQGEETVYKLVLKLEYQNNIYSCRDRTSLLEYMNDENLKLWDKLHEAKIGDQIVITDYFRTTAVQVSMTYNLYTVLKVSRNITQKEFEREFK